MVPIPLRVQEGDDPLYRVTATKLYPDGTVGPVDLTSGIITMRIKLTKDTPDVDALGSFTGTIVPPSTNGVFTVQVLSSVTTAPGDYWYTTKMVAAGKQQTLQYGEFIVENT